mmetsp:Transcript_20890/g.58089  ORF Transcript_20890/g.58089 Transcript_20890/m.58089 type:complete len:202 (+) Transcript_20890:1507-2112(+)
MCHTPSCPNLILIIHARVEIGLSKGLAHDRKHIVLLLPIIPALPIVFRRDATQLTQLVQRYRGKVMMFAMVVRAQRQNRVPSPRVGRSRRHAAAIRLVNVRAMVRHEHGARGMRRDTPQGLGQVQEQKRPPSCEFEQHPAQQHGPATVGSALLMEFIRFVGEEGVAARHGHDDIVDHEHAAFEQEARGEHEGVPCSVARDP